MGSASSSRALPRCSTADGNCLGGQRTSELEINDIGRFKFMQISEGLLFLASKVAVAISQAEHKVLK